MGVNTPVRHTLLTLGDGTSLITSQKIRHWIISVIYYVNTKNKVHYITESKATSPMIQLEPHSSETGIMEPS
jgi:hypothetical protein